MRRRAGGRALLASVVVALAFASQAQPQAPSQAPAQELASLCEKVLALEVGQWAEYQLSGAGLGGDSQMRLAVVGKQPVAGKTAWWIELKMAGESGRMVTQVLASGYPYEADEIHQMVVKMGDQPAMRMPQQGLAMMRGRMRDGPSVGSTGDCVRSKVVGVETVEVPAGEITALRIQPADAASDVWAKAEIPFGLVKLVRKDGRIELLAHGRDAKSSILEEPLSIPGLGGG